MSVVTGVMLICSLMDGDDIIPEINQWLAKLDEREGYYALKDSADEVSGGWKHPQFGGWCGDFNHFAPHQDEFASFVLSRDWTFPENLVLVMQPEDGETQVYRIKGYQITAPPPSPEQKEFAARRTYGPPDLTRWAHGRGTRSPEAPPARPAGTPPPSRPTR